ncbi:MAG: tRNA (pseudouridine(54)-N(1))-methyltransferase TrmY [Candidatus Heimdallarchaeota archaeon]|nr:tRNA (pseudouridine(54)-N(1))-methyltransferase TrmY [Candidatus Heimdallarchaeota archaeon]
MYEFVLFSRQGFTDGNFSSLIEAGRLDTVYQCIFASIFKSHGHRKDVKFHAFLYGPPKPPIHLEVIGESLYNVRVDERTWTEIIKKVLNGGTHPGINIIRNSFEAFIKEKVGLNEKIFVLEEKGEVIGEMEFGQSAIFIIGDHIGLPREKEKFVLRNGRKLSLGKQKYLAASCIGIINYELDKYVQRNYSITR